MACAVLLYFLALAAAATFGEEPIKWTHLIVKWGVLLPYNLREVPPFYKMPLTTQEATKEKWKQAESTNITTLWCYMKNPRVCILYDLQGTVAGMQISVLVDDIVFPGNDSLDNHPWLFKNNIYGKDLYSARYYLVDQATLAAGGRPPSEEVGTGLWLQSGSDLVQVPRDGDQLEAQSWTRENCFRGMGRHYYYNMSKEMSCEDLQPFFLLLDNQYNSLHGVGFQMFGKPTSKPILRFWFESRIASSDIIFSNAPRCMKDMEWDHSIYSFHMYFVGRPRQISCEK